MAYEFIATGLKPAQPVKSFIDSYMQGKEFQQNQEINKVNIEAGQKRNELTDIQLKDAQKQVDAEDQWSKLPRSENGVIDPQAEQQFKTVFTKYYDTRVKADLAQQADKFAILSNKLTASSILFGSVHTPEQLAKATETAKQFGLDIVNPDTFAHMAVSTSKLGQETEAQIGDVKNLIAAGKHDEAKLLMSSLTAKAQESQAKLRLIDAQISAQNADALFKNTKSNVLQEHGGNINKPPSKYRWKEDGSLEAIPGGPADPNAPIPRDKVNLRTAERSVTDIDALLSQIPSVEGAIKGEGLGVGNIIQRGTSKVINPVLTLFGDEGVKATAQEFGDAQTLRQFRKAVQIAFINNPKFPVEEQKKVEALFSEINPDSVSSAKGTALVPLMEIITVLKNQREKSAAFLENRKPNYIERPRLGNEADPIISPVPYAQKDTPEMQEYLRKNGAKPGMIIQWPDRSTSTLGGKK